ADDLVAVRSEHFYGYIGLDERHAMAGQPKVCDDGVVTAERQDRLGLVVGERGRVVVRRQCSAPFEPLLEQHHISACQAEIRGGGQAVWPGADDGDLVVHGHWRSCSGKLAAASRASRRARLSSYHWQGRAVHQGWLRTPASSATTWAAL